MLVGFGSMFAHFFSCGGQPAEKEIQLQITGITLAP